MWGSGNRQKMTKQKQLSCEEMETENDNTKNS